MPTAFSNSDSPVVGYCSIHNSSQVYVPNFVPVPQKTHVPENLSQASLLTSGQSDAGRYIINNYKIGDGLVALSEVIDVWKSLWKNCLVGSFQDKNLPCHVVIKHLLRVWKLKGTIKINYGKDTFYFNFSCLDDKARILESDPFNCL